jgi:outer membrane protein insertion porin family
MDVVISLEEQSWASFKFALAFSGGEFPVSGQVGWSDANFLGTGRTLGADLEGSIFRQGLAVNFQDDYLFGDQWGGGVNLSFYHNRVQNVLQDIDGVIFEDEDVPDPYDSLEEYENRDTDSLNIADLSTMEYDSLDISVGLNTGYSYRTRLGRLGINTGLSSTMTRIWYDDDIYRPYSSLVRDNLREWDFVNNLGTTLYWDNRDIFYNPTKGHYISHYTGLTGGLLLGSRDFIKLTTRAEGYLTLLDQPVGDKYNFKMVLATHSDINFILPQFFNAEDREFESSLRLTPGDKLAVDGMLVGRGWDYRGDHLALWNNIAELRIPLFEQFLWWSWFFDAVGAWPERDGIRKIGVEDFYFSWGGGLRFTMPGLPIRLYLAQAFNLRDGIQDGVIARDSLNLNFVIAITLPGGF